MKMKRKFKYDELCIQIKTIFQENGSCYGYRRIHGELKKIGITVLEKIVRRIMKEEDLKVEKIYKVEVTRNLNGVLRIPAEQLGIDKDTKHIWLEAELKKHTGKNMPLTLFRSTMPEFSAHMFCDFEICGE